ncbi:MAG: NUMOD3 domain-containing DNA-binding protein [Candidatus Nitrosotenuis sp.]
MRIMTPEHRQKISLAKVGKRRSVATRVKLSLRLMGGRHHRALLWTLESPAGKFFITKDIAGFCELHELNYSILRHKAQQKDSSPVTRGKSKGWSVLKRENPHALISEFKK